MKEISQKAAVSKSIQQFNRQCAEQRAKFGSTFNKDQKRVHNYLIDNSCILGRGTFSTVYKGKDLVRAKDVAVKVIEVSKIQQTGIQKLFKEELNIIQRLNHPNIVACLEYFRTTNNCYTIYQFCQEGDLAKMLQKGHLGQKEDLHQANSYIKDVFQGLLYLQSVNIVHRDIKAANIFLDQGKAKIGDFGFATRCNSQFRDASIGSPAYMAPEGLIHNYYGPKTDVWAFGMLIYEMLHGSTPFYQCVSEVDLKKRIKIPINWDQLKTNLPSALKRLILKCLKVDPKQRPSFSELLNDEYIRKIYSQTSAKRLNAKSNYSRHTSDTQKLFESTSISSILQEIRKKDSSQTAEHKSQEITSQHDSSSKNQLLLPMKLQKEQQEEENAFYSEIEELNASKNQSQQAESQQSCLEKDLQLMVQEQVLLLNSVNYRSSLLDIIGITRIFIETMMLQRQLQLNLPQPLSFHLVVDQLLKEIYCLSKIQNLNTALELAKIDYQRFLKLIKDSTLPEKSQIQIKTAHESIFELLKQVQILIDKQSINNNLQNALSTDNKSLTQYGNYLILSYKYLQALGDKKELKVEAANQKFQSSQQFYIELYELELRRMEEV